MDHNLTRELASWAERLGWRWFAKVDTGPPESVLADAEGRELGRDGPHLGDPWGWVLDPYNGVVREGDAPTGRVAKGELLAEALLWAFVHRLDGWRVHRIDDGDVRIYKSVVVDDEDMMAMCRRSVDRPGNWFVRSVQAIDDADSWRMLEDERGGGYWGDVRSALAAAVCRTMELLDGQLQGEALVDPTPIDLEQLARTREALSRLPD